MIVNHMGEMQMDIGIEGIEELRNYRVEVGSSHIFIIQDFGRS